MAPDELSKSGQLSRDIAKIGVPVVDPGAWAGADLVDREDWIYTFSDDEIAALEEVASNIRAQISDDANRLLNLETASFGLGAANEALEHSRRQLQDGLGFILMRGLPVEKWDRLTSAIVYWALGRNMGTPLSNNPQGDMLGHVVNLGKDFDDPNHRAYQTNSTMFYHADQCDVVGLLCLQKSKAGGASKIASSLYAHNMLVERAPELAAELAQPVCWSRLGEVGPDQAPWYEAPIFDYVDGHLSVSAGFKHIEKGHDLPQTPPLSEATRAGMLMLNDLCEEFHLTMDFEPGDIQFLNNYVCLHTRTGFEDWPELERRRHLWRIWLNVPGLRPPSAYARNWVQGVWAPSDAQNVTLAAF